MKFELSQNVEQWCEEALSEIDGMPAPLCDKIQAAALVYQAKVLAEISDKLSGITKAKPVMRAAVGAR